MPLIKYASKEAIGENIKEMVASGHPRNQAIAAALDTARRAKRAHGGKVHVGPIKGNKPGRTDVHEMNVPDGAYILSSDVVSHLGDSNTDAGLKMAHHLFGEGGINDPRKRASGGSVTGKSVPCLTAGGEYSIHPRIVKNIGHGDVDLGHRILDHYSMMVRKDHISTLKNLPPPAQD